MRVRVCWLGFYGFAVGFAWLLISGLATGHVRATALGRVPLLACSLSWLLCVHAMTVFVWKRYRVEPLPAAWRRESLDWLVCPRPQAEPELSVWWWNRVAMALFLAFVGLLGVTVVLGRMGLL